MVFSSEPFYLVFSQIIDFAVKKCSIVSFVAFTEITDLDEGFSNYVEPVIILKWSVIQSFTMEGYLESYQKFKIERLGKNVND